jgi:hypothetical protein
VSVSLGPSSNRTLLPANLSVAAVISKMRIP